MDWLVQGCWHPRLNSHESHKHTPQCYHHTMHAQTYKWQEPRVSKFHQLAQITSKPGFKLTSKRKLLRFHQRKGSVKKKCR